MPSYTMASTAAVMTPVHRGGLVPQGALKTVGKPTRGGARPFLTALMGVGAAADATADGPAGRAPNNIGLMHSQSAPGFS